MTRKFGAAAPLLIELVDNRELREEVTALLDHLRLWLNKDSPQGWREVYLEEWPAYDANDRKCRLCIVAWHDETMAVAKVVGSVEYDNQGVSTSHHKDAVPLLSEVFASEAYTLTIKRCQALASDLRSAFRLWLDGQRRLHKTASREIQAVQVETGAQ